MANNAFDAMNESAGGDMYLTGGAISVSEYEQNMTPEDQKKFETLVMNEFMASYSSDPHKGNLDFKHWLGSLNVDLVREKALKFDDLRAENYGIQKIMQRADGRELEDAGMLQKLAHLHTGRIEDLIAIVESNTDDMGSQAPPQAAPGMAPPASMGPQDMLNYPGTNKELFNELGQTYKDNSGKPIDRGAFDPKTGKLIHTRKSTVSGRETSY